jgi:hypothetical protein|tara:strand:- start:2556 stop:2735 length:180 start_codon:yes stop_codon:yes gene_type:complete
MTTLIYKGSQKAADFSKRMLEQATTRETTRTLSEYKRAFEQAGQLSAEEDLERREKEED